MSDDDADGLPAMIDDRVSEIDESQRLGSPLLRRA
jgi:hypothetical protein